MNVDARTVAATADSAAPAPEIQRVGVVGAGQMGNGIAHVCSLAGLPVVMLDIKQEALEKALAVMAANMDRQVKRGLITAEDKAAALSRVTTTTDYAAFGDCDLVVEAATEKEEIKRAVFKTLVPHLSPRCMLATNTSSISITRLGAGTDRPEKFIGMHFMNPVPVMSLVEVIRGHATAEATFALTAELVAKLGKEMAVAQDYPGFIANRVLMPMLNEAIFALYEGVASAEDIDKAMKLCTNQPMGPLVLADFIGLDTVLAILRVLHEGFGDPKFRPCPLLVKMVNAGHLGRKSGRGFYSYE